MKQKNSKHSVSTKLTIQITPRGDRSKRRKKKVTKRELQVPLREKDLTTTDEFIRYCNEYAVKTDRAELEYFEKEGLLLPAVRISSGVLEFKRVLADFNGKQEWRYILKPGMRKVRARYKVKKVERRIYYMPGTWGMGERGWLERLKKMGLVKYPARQKFRPWRYYELWEYYEREKDGYVTDWKILENAAEAMYSKLQMYPLKMIQRNRRLLIKNEMLSELPEQWAKLGESVYRAWNSERSKDRVRYRVVEYNRVFRLLFSIEDLWAEYSETFSEKYKQLMEEHGGDTRAVDADLRQQREPLDSHLSPAAKSGLKKHGFTVRDLEGLQIRFMGFGSFGLTSKFAEKYVRFVEDNMLASTEGPYKIVDLLGWYIRLCGGKRRTAKELILRSSKYKYCLYCGEPYMPRVRNQKSCGSPACRQVHSNALKRSGRRTGKYKS